MTTLIICPVLGSHGYPLVAHYPYSGTKGAYACWKRDGWEPTRRVFNTILPGLSSGLCSLLSVCLTNCYAVPYHKTQGISVAGCCLPGVMSHVKGLQCDLKCILESLLRPKWMGSMPTSKIAIEETLWDTMLTRCPLFMGFISIEKSDLNTYLDCG